MCLNLIFQQENAALLVASVFWGSLCFFPLTPLLRTPAFSPQRCVCLVPFLLPGRLVAAASLSSYKRVGTFCYPQSSYMPCSLFWKPISDPTHHSLTVRPHGISDLARSGWELAVSFSGAGTRLPEAGSLPKVPCALRAEVFTAQAWAGQVLQIPASGSTPALGQRLGVELQGCSVWWDVSVRLRPGPTLTGLWRQWELG